MHNRILKISLFCAAFIAAPVFAFADDDLTRRADWERPDATLVKPQIISWLETQNVEDALRQEVLALWGDASGSLVGVALLERTVASFAKVDDRAREIFEKCQASEGGLVPPKFEILEDEKVDAFVRNNLALYHARWLSQNRYYDESLVGIQELGPEDVVDPASLLFYQCVAYHRFMDKKECLSRAEKLLRREDEIPRRYTRVAMLMEADLQPLKVDSLDEVSRLMDDIHRRLDLGRAGTKVRKQEDDVIAKLDKMIEELEKQQQQQQQPGPGQQGNKPMEDSMEAQQTGKGSVDPKKIANRESWGDLPPKERQESLQRISKEFPSHYREAIEEYFRKLARDGVNE